jgi:hypothetical protein
MSATDKLPEITAVEILRPQPGDTLIIRVPGVISAEQAEQIKVEVRKRLPLPLDLPVLVLSGGTRVEILRPDPKNVLAEPHVSGGSSARAITTSH